MSEKLRVGIIGTGSISHCHVAGYKKLVDDVDLVCACDIDEKKLTKYCEQYDIPHKYTDYNEMLEKENLDAISVTTWNAEHCAATIAALNHGVNVLCEKPMAMNAAQAEEMFEAAKKNGKLLQIGFVKRFNYESLTIKYMIEQGSLGNLQYARAKYLRRAGYPGSWFGDKSYSGGGPIIDLGVHIIDLSRYLAGNPKPVSVFARTYNLPINRAENSSYYWSYYDPACGYKYDVEDFATGMIVFDNGFTLHIETSFNFNCETDVTDLQIFGDKAGAVVEGGPKQVFGVKDGLFVDYKIPDFIRGIKYKNQFDNEIYHFVDSVKNGTPCRATAEDGITLMKILDAFYESARTGELVHIK